MITMKFGGTSVQDARAITNVAVIVKKSLARQPVVVVSAIAQATNTLEKIGTAARDGNGALALSETDALVRRHGSIVDDLIRDPGTKKLLADFIAGAGDSINSLTAGVEKLGELTPRTMDALYAFGELLSSRIVAAALDERGVPSTWLDTQDFMVTDDHFGRARPLMDLLTPRLERAVRPVIGDGRVPVTQGFIGVTESGLRTTMGRESSDYSGSLIGSALGAEVIQIWTDVAGVLTGDPRVVASPSVVESLSFSEAYELTYFGAKVLHPGTMIPAEAKGVPIEIRKSADPDLPGTRVSSARGKGPAAVRSITSLSDVAALTLTPRRRGGLNPVREYLSGLLTLKDGQILLMNTTDDRAVLVLRSGDDCGELIEILKDICAAEVRTGVSLVSAVGEQIAADARLQSRFFSAIGARPVYFTSRGASGNSLIAVIDSPGTEEAVRSLHTEYFGRASSR